MRGAVERKRFAAPVLRQINDSVCQRFARARDLPALSKDLDVTRVERQKAKRRLADMPFAASDQAAEANDLARAHMERGLPKAAFATGDPNERKRSLARFRGDVRIEALEGTPHHVADQALVGESLDEIVGDALPVAQHRYAIAKRADLFEPMRDIENGPAFAAKSADNGEKEFGFLVRERRRRLVEDYRAGFAAQRPQDLQQLLLGAGKRLDPGVDVQLDVEVGEDAGDVRTHLPLAQKHAAGLLAAEK